jgi:hypothetical protein
MSAIDREKLYEAALHYINVDDETPRSRPYLWTEDEWTAAMDRLDAARTRLAAATAPPAPLDVGVKVPCIVCDGLGTINAKELARRIDAIAATQLDADRLRRANLRHHAAERQAWAAKGEYGVMHVCGFSESSHCVEAIAREYEAGDEADR